MKIIELFERINTNILVVDVQPAYDKYCHKVALDICNLLNKQTGNIVVMYNGGEVTNDSLADIQNYYIDMGLDSELIEDNKIKFVEKEYAFLRGWIMM